VRDASRIFISKSARLCWFLGLLCFASAFVSPASASSPQQSVAQQRLPGQSAPQKAALQGVVRDSNRKPVIGASVILRNLATNQKIEKVSSAQGVFRFIDVAPGDYELKIAATGFQEFTNPALQLKPVTISSATSRSSPAPPPRHHSRSSPSFPPEPQIRQQALSPSLRPQFHPMPCRMATFSNLANHPRRNRCLRPTKFFIPILIAGPSPCPIGTVTESAANILT